MSDNSTAGEPAADITGVAALVKGLETIRNECEPGDFLHLIAANALAVFDASAPAPVAGVQVAPDQSLLPAVLALDAAIHKVLIAGGDHGDELSDIHLRETLKRAQQTAYRALIGIGIERIPGSVNPLSAFLPKESLAAAPAALSESAPSRAEVVERFDWSRKGMVLSTEGYYKHVDPKNDAGIVRGASGSPPEPALRDGATAGALNGIPATMRHDEGAIARCSYCKRYSLDPATLGEDRYQPVCECGQKHGWCGSFVHPDANAVWSGQAPVAPVVAIEAGSVGGALTNEQMRDAVAEGLRGMYGCGRVWSAWSVGTMTEDDFYPAEESDECITQVVDAIATAVAGQSGKDGEAE